MLRLSRKLKGHTPTARGKSAHTLVISTVPRASNPARRVWRWVGQTMLWLLAVLPGCLMIAYGAEGILKERLVTVGRFGREDHVWTGVGAVGWGWIFVGVGFSALGYFCHLKTGYVLVKILGWVFGGIAAMIGVGVFLNGFAERVS